MKRARKPRVLRTLFGKAVVASAYPWGDVHLALDVIGPDTAKRLHAWLGRYLKWANARKKK